jgi:hypothetical protein
LRDLPQSISRAEQTAKHKCPLLQLPSGLFFGLQEGLTDPEDVTLRLFDTLKIPLSGTRNEAFTHTSERAGQAGYVVKKKGVNGLEIIGYDERDHFMVMYDNPRHRLFDIQRVEPEPRSRLSQAQPSPEPALISEQSPTEVVAPAIKPEPAPQLISPELAAEIPAPTEPPSITHEERADALIRKSIYLRLVNLADKQETPANSVVGLLTRAALTVLDALDYGLSRREIQIAIQIGEYLREEKLASKTASK